MENSLYLHPDSMFIVMDMEGNGKIYISDYDEVSFDSKIMPLSNPLYKAYSHIVGRYIKEKDKKREAFKQEFRRRLYVN